MEVYQNKQTILKLEYPKLREEIPALGPLFGQGRLQSPWVKSGDRQGLVLHPRGELNRNGEKGVRSSILPRSSIVSTLGGCC